MKSLQELRFKKTMTINYSTNVESVMRAKVIKDALPLLDAQAKCREIWQALQIADYKKKGVLNEAALEVLLEKQGRNLNTLLSVKTTEEILDLLDEEELGYLNEDEQILIFSVIKERMQKSAYDLCNIHEYELYKKMMKAIRALENDIIEYQSVLRSGTYEKEMEIYKKIGAEKFENFKKIWAEIFENFEKTCEEKMRGIIEAHQEQLDALDEKLNENFEILKIKPKPLMKNLQTQEKLFALNERYAEAHQIRTELKVLEVSEQNRVENEILRQKEKQRKKLMKAQKMEVEQLKLKNQTSFNKLKIRYEQEKMRLEKEIKLHNHDIKRNQNLASRLAVKIGKTRDELRRTKQNAKNLQSYLKEVKRNKSARNLYENTLEKTGAYKIGTMMGSYKSSNIGINVAKINTAHLTRFGIKSDGAGTDRPVNVPPGFMNSTSFSAKTGKLLQQSRKEKNLLPSLTNLYNEKLEPMNKELNE